MPGQDLDKAHDVSKLDISTVVSILPVKIDESKPGLLPTQYIIPAVLDPRKDVNTLLVARARFPVYLDENRPALIVPAPSDVVADSICRDYKVSMSEYVPGVAEPGLFWLRGSLTVKDIETTHKDELSRARELQIAWFHKLVETADDDWGKYKMRRMVSSIQRQACNVLKLDREWNTEKESNFNLSLKPCPFCRADVHPEAIICTHCRGIINMERYKTEYREAGVATLTK